MKWVALKVSRHIGNRRLRLYLSVDLFRIPVNLEPMTTKRSFVLALALLLLAPAARAASGLTPHERATVIAARHLLVSIGNPKLDAAIHDRSLRTDGYWQKVFAAAGAPTLYALVAADLQRAMAEVPLVNGQPAAPDVFARAVLRGIGPMPMMPVNESSPAERKAVLEFARKELADFSKAAFDDPANADLAAAAAAARARLVFHSPAIADAFFRLGDLLGADEKDRIDLVDTKDRLNEYLHPFGLHLVLDANDFNAGHANLASYVILSKNTFNILGKAFVVYEARPAIDSQSTSALGHAEVEPGYMFMFANHVDQETESGMAFAGGGFIDLSSVSSLSRASIEAIEAAVRDRIRAGTNLVKANYRALLINTIGRHEGFHMYIEPAIATALRRGKVGRDVASIWHENGAYLYQLEVSDPRFTHMDLLSVLLTAIHPNDTFPANTAGARAAMNDLQMYIKDVSFWDSAAQAPKEEGLVKLFRLSPEEIQNAASQARWSYEVRVRE